MKDLGITVIAEEVFREGEYFVLELQIQHVDMIMLIEAFPRLDIDGDNEKIDLMNLNESELDKLIEEKKNTTAETKSHPTDYAKRSYIPISNRNYCEIYQPAFFSFSWLENRFFSEQVYAYSCTFNDT
uniref:Uncharacterized protein n=1 Tax=Corethron hystrix TaxID=216773 RepID=A0A7S1BV28_9STRA|mmetsp:Transcript_40532/g.95180  ORF Transcript_40532/g.95180 Transcript_40532/m.95180 type:complete len:128 (+) Transcript_40532:518-901(+)